MEQIKYAIGRSLPRQKRSRSAGDGGLSGQSVLLLIVHGLFAAANALSGTFVNVYLWKASHDFALIGSFALAGQAAGTLTFLLAGNWVKTHNKMNCLRLGVALSALFYLCVLALGVQSVQYAPALGALQGAASGFFWLAFNVVYFEVTGPDDRDRFNGWSGFIGSGTSMIAPWLSGLLITQIGNGSGSGYRFIFTLSLFIFVAGAIVSFFLRKRPPEERFNWARIAESLRDRRSPWRLVVPALAAQGAREGVFTFIIGVLIFVATGNEAKVGNYWLYASAAGLASYWAVGRFIKQRQRKGAMLAAVIMMTAAIVPFFYAVNYTTLLLFGVVVGVFFPMFIVPLTSSVFDLIGRDDESARHRVEYVVLRELGLGAGRMAGTLVFIVVVSQSAALMTMNWLLLGIGSSCIVAWLFMRRFLDMGVRYSVDKRKE